ncbi:unnamed protein product [Moneuplotes crassus]|uniref:Uncharacterized protein n=1 Tax=Euplotes crassus TaxID=5936 RepID=A0AAD2D036_EUPCR|nr:unnamed protein product [Moneuplotes crassus]
MLSPQKRLHRKIRNKVVEHTGNRELMFRLLDQNNQFYIDQRGYQWRLQAVNEKSVTFNCTYLGCKETIIAMCQSPSLELSQKNTVYKTKGYFMYHFHEPIADPNFVGIKCHEELPKKDIIDEISNFDAYESARESFGIRDTQDLQHPASEAFDQYQYDTQIECKELSQGTDQGTCGLTQTTNGFMNDYLEECSRFDTDHKSISSAVLYSQSYSCANGKGNARQDTKDSSDENLDKSTADSSENEHLPPNKMTINFDSIRSLFELKKELDKRGINLENIHMIFKSGPSQDQDMIKADASEAHV